MHGAWGTRLGSNQPCAFLFRILLDNPMAQPRPHTCPDPTPFPSFCNLGVGSGHETSYRCGLHGPAPSTPLYCIWYQVVALSLKLWCGDRDRTVLALALVIERGILMVLCEQNDEPTTSVDSYGQNSLTWKGLR